MQTRCRFTSEFKVRLVLDVLTGVQSQAEACRKHSLSPNLLANWKSAFLERAHIVFQTEVPETAEQSRIAELERVLGRLTLDCTFPENTEPAATGQGVVSADFSAPTGERPSRARRGSPR